MTKTPRARSPAVALLMLLAPPAVAGAALSTDEASLLARLDAGRALASIRHLSRDVVRGDSGLGAGTAVAGSPEEAALARDIADSMRGIGLDVHIERFPVRAYRYGPVTAAADGLPLAAISLHAAGGTWGRRDGVAYVRGNEAAGHQLRATLVDAGDGYAPDYDRLGDVRGRAVLVHRELRDWPSAQITESAYRGAAAIVFYDYPLSAGEQDALRQDSMWAHEQIPAIAISLRSATALRATLGVHPVTLTLENRVDVEDGHSQNVVGILRGRTHPNEWAMVAAHYDRWFQGAGDNTSGVAAVLELARAFTASGKRPARSMIFMATGAEEAGIPDPERDWLAGSHAFLQQHPDVMRHAALIFNLDLVGWTSPAGTLMSTPDILAAQRRVLGDLGMSSTMEVVVPTSSAIDAWNYGVVGGAAMNHLWRATFTGTPAAPAYFPIYHTQLDVFRREHYGNMAGDLRLVALSLSRAANAGRMPIVLTALADHVGELLAADAKQVPDVSFHEALAALADFREASAGVEAAAASGDADSADRLLMAVRHGLVPWLYAVNDDFEQVPRTGAYVHRVGALDRAIAAIAADDHAAARVALNEMYEGRQCLRLSPASYDIELGFAAGEGGWATQFSHRAPAPSAAFTRACNALKSPVTAPGTIVADLRTARTEAANGVESALRLISAQLRSATGALTAFPSHPTPPATGSTTERFPP